MTCAEILSHLNSLNPLLVTAGDMDRELLSCRQLTEIGAELCPDTLYVCCASLFASCQPQTCHCSFLIIEDREKADLSIFSGSRKHNIILFPAPAEAKNILDTVEGLLRQELYYGHQLEYIMHSYEKHKDFQSIADAAYSVLGNPIIISDSSFKILAMSQDVDYSGILPEVGQPDSEIPKACLSLMRQDRIFENYREGEFLLMDEKQYTWLFYPVYASGIRCGAIGSVAVNSSFSLFDRQLIRRVAMLVAMELQKLQEFNISKDLQYDYLFFDMLQGKSPENTLRARARYMGWSLAEHLQILCMHIPSAEKKGDVIQCGQRLGEQVKRILHNCRYSIYENHLVFIVSASAIEELLSENERYSLLVFCKNNRVSVGVSNHFGDFDKARLAYQQAQKALLMGPVFCRNESAKGSKEYGLYAYRDIAPYHICETLYQENNSVIFLHSAIRQLAQHDEKKGTCLMETLFSYLRHNADIGIIAEELHIHGNTLRYRINRIKEICGLDLKDGEENMLLLLSIYLKKYQSFSNRNIENYEKS